MSNLLFEKLGFAQNKEERKEILQAALKNKLPKVQMYNIALRVTDKPIDFEEIYKSYLDLKGTREKKPKINATKRLGIVIEALRKRNIDIVKNDIGETVIDYNASESFANRIKREQTNSSKEYRESVYIGNSIEKESVQQQGQEEAKSRTEPTLDVEER